MERSHDLGDHCLPPELTDLLHRPVWHLLAACRGEPVALFFPEPGLTLRAVGRPAVIRTLCGRCPVHRRCAEAGQDEPDGIWGGTEPGERLSSWVPAAAMEHASRA